MGVFSKGNYRFCYMFIVREKHSNMGGGKIRYCAYLLGLQPIFSVNLDHLRLLTCICSTEPLIFFSIHIYKFCAFMFFFSYIQILHACMDTNI